MSASLSNKAVKHLPLRARTMPNAGLKTVNAFPPNKAAKASEGFKNGNECNPKNDERIKPQSI